MIAIHRLVKQELQPVFDMSLEVFQPDPSEQHTYHDIREWQKLMDEGAIVLGAYVDKHLGGFLFARREPEGHLHIWLAGVVPTMRQQGILRDLLKKIQIVAKEEEIKLVTINTYPEKFPIMSELLPRYGFTLDRQEDQVVNGVPTVKSFFRQEIV